MPSYQWLGDTSVHRQQRFCYRENMLSKLITSAKKPNGPETISWFMDAMTVWSCSVLLVTIFAKLLTKQDRRWVHTVQLTLGEVHPGAFTPTGKFKETEQKGPSRVSKHGTFVLSRHAADWFLIQLNPKAFLDFWDIIIGSPHFFVWPKPKIMNRKKESVIWNMN